MNCNSKPIDSHVSPSQNAYKITYPKLKGLKFAHVNITSLPKHLEELRWFLQEIPFEILSLNETRLDETIQNNIVQIPGYEIIRRDRNRRGGGVAFLVKNSYSYTVRNDLLPNDIEAICIELTLRMSRSILVLTWYRPPNSDAQVINRFEKISAKG